MKILAPDMTNYDYESSANSCFAVRLIINISTHRKSKKRRFVHGMYYLYYDEENSKLIYSAYIKIIDRHDSFEICLYNTKS